MKSRDSILKFVGKKTQLLNLNQFNFVLFLVCWKKRRDWKLKKEKEKKYKI